jgi:hypothetical protein
VTGFTPTALASPYGFVAWHVFSRDRDKQRTSPWQQVRAVWERHPDRIHTGWQSTFPSLTFTEGATKKTFTPAQITTDTSGLGTLVSVALVQTVDTGGTRFGFFLPDVQLTRGQSAPVTTVGVFETFSGPDSVPHRPTTWQSVHLHGVAEEVIVPL